MFDLASITSIFTWIIPFLLVLTVIVFVHEYGHFKVARLCGVRVKVFSVGFGRALWSGTDRYGTEWRFAWMPLGGYVKFAGDANASSMTSEEDSETPEPGEFHSASVWRRIAIVLAGPAANFIFAIVVFAGIFMTIGIPVTSTVISEVITGSAAEEAGFQAGDRVVSINGSKVRNFRDITRNVIGNADTEISIKVIRDGETLTLKAVPKRVERDNSIGGKVSVGQLGVRSEQQLTATYERTGPITAIRLGIDQSWFIITSSLSYMGKIISGHENANQVSGPVGIAQISKQAADAGGLALLQLIAFLSVSIGLINLFPIPVLDGGHLLYYAIEVIRGKPLGQQAQETGFKVGLALVLTLMIAVVWNDLQRVLWS